MLQVQLLYRRIMLLYFENGRKRNQFPIYIYFLHVISHELPHIPRTLFPSDQIHHSPYPEDLHTLSKCLFPIHKVVRNSKTATELKAKFCLKLSGLSVSFVRKLLGWAYTFATKSFFGPITFGPC